MTSKNSKVVRDTKDKTIKAPSGRRYHFLDTSDFTDADFHSLSNEKDENIRRASILRKSKTDCSPEVTTKVQNMTIIEEVTSILLFLLGVPGAAYSLPVIGTVIYKLFGTAATVSFIACLIGLAYAPAKFSMSALNSWPAISILRYFSFKGVFATPLDSKRAYILVAPPHGVS